MKVRMAVATAAVAVLGTLVLPAPAQASPDCDQEPAPPICHLPEPDQGHNPTGALTEVTRNRGLVTVRGKATDPDAPDKMVQVALQVDGLPVTYAGATPDFEATLVSSLDPGTHTVCADAENIGEGSGPVRLGCLTYTVPAPVGTPTVGMVPDGTDGLLLEWKPADDNATGFRINHTYGGTWSEVTTLPADARSYRESGLAPGTPVCVQVVAFNDFSEQGAAVCGTSLKEALPLFTEAETSLGEVTHSSITLKWEDHSIATAYAVDLLYNGQVLAHTDVDGTVRQFRFTGLDSETTYGLRVTRSHPEHAPPADLGPATEEVRTLVNPNIAALNVSPSAAKSCSAPQESVVGGTVYFTNRVEVSSGSQSWVFYRESSADYFNFYLRTQVRAGTSFQVIVYGTDGGRTFRTLTVDTIPPTPGTTATSAFVITNASDSEYVAYLIDSRGVAASLGRVRPHETATLTLGSWGACYTGHLELWNAQAVKVYTGTTEYTFDAYTGTPMSLTI